MVEMMTISALLSKMKKNSYIGTKNYGGSDDKKFTEFDLYIIDEASMITNEDFIDIAKFSSRYKKILLFIGDINQIPHPTQKYKKEIINCKQYLVKEDSPAFHVKNIFKLTELMRQNNNPIIDVYNSIITNMNNELPYERITNLCETETGTQKGIIFTNDSDEFNAYISDVFMLAKNTVSRNNDSCSKYDMNRVICYTNSCVLKYNTLIRKILNFENIYPEESELLMGYENIGYPTRTIENGEDYVVKKSFHVDNYSINIDGKKFKNIVGHSLTLRSDCNKLKKIFLPELHNPDNNDIINHLCILAEKVNQKNSTTADFIKYSKVKNKLFFMQNIFKYDNEYYLENDLKNKHPLLFTKVFKIMSDKTGELSDNELTDKFIEEYEDVYIKRQDDYKKISTNEVFADMFQIINKDLDFGYAITSHKSQGSTFEIIFCDEKDYECLKDDYDLNKNCIINKTREKNQLKYVAFTRPSNLAICYF